MKFISRDWLKILAFVTMLLDHFAAVFLDSQTVLYVVLRNIGRVSFLIFCILFVEGFLYTKHYKTHLRDLIVFALLSEVPYDMAFHLSFGLDFAHQNVLLSWLFGFLLLMCLSYLSDLSSVLGSASVFVQWLCIFGFACVGEWLCLDYGACCQLCIGVCFFMMCSKKIPLYVVACVVCAILGMNYHMWTVMFVVVPFLFYNGNQKWSKPLKYLYYVGYPLHLVLFGLLVMFVV